MHAVLCSLGPSDVVGLKTNALSVAIDEALNEWLADPTTEA
jgi:hypothetical protein